MGQKKVQLLNDPRTKFLRENVQVPEGVDKDKTLIVLGETSPNFGRFYSRSSGPPYITTFYGEPISNAERSRLRESLRAHLTKQTMSVNAQTLETKAEEKRLSKAGEQLLDVPIALYTEDGRAPVQFMGKGIPSQDGILFSWDNQVFPQFLSERPIAFERRLENGVFQRCLEQYEWMPLQSGRMQVYRVAGVSECIGVDRYFSVPCTPNKRTESLPSASPPFHMRANSPSLGKRDRILSKFKASTEPKKRKRSQSPHIVDLTIEENDYTEQREKWKAKRCRQGDSSSRKGKSRVIVDGYITDGVIDISE